MFLLKTQGHSWDWKKKNWFVSALGVLFIPMHTISERVIKQFQFMQVLYIFFRCFPIMLMFGTLFSIFHPCTCFVIIENIMF